MLTDYGATRSDEKIGLNNLGSFWENEPKLRGILRLFEAILRGLACLFAAGFGLFVGLMLLNQTTNVHLSTGGRGSRVGIHIICLAIP
jgi:hypothetical protein